MRPVVICLKVRRFLCQNVACKAVTFDGQANVTVRQAAPVRRKHALDPVHDHAAQVRKKISDGRRGQGK